MDKTGNNKRFDSLGKMFAMLAATSVLTGWILLWKDVSIPLIDSGLFWVRDVSIYTTVVFSILEAFTEKDRSYVWYFFHFYDINISYFGNSIIINRNMISINAGKD